mgnify:FL=1
MMNATLEAVAEMESSALGGLKKETQWSMPRIWNKDGGVRYSIFFSMAGGKR